ncbi:MAG: hypothetical protein ACI9KE_006592 [Polyangiales bacterium]|jgi:hypothetical protein
MRLTILHRASLLATMLIACNGSPEPSANPAQAAPEVIAPEAAASDPVAELAALDGRQPVPLQPMMAWHQKQNMMEHLVAIQRITSGLSEENWEEIASAATRIGTSPQMQQMCQHMGAGAPGFTDMALDFHRRADSIGEAARAQDSAAVLSATAHTLQACTTCHATFRQEVLDLDTWQQRTGSAHAPAAHSH